MNYPSPGPAGLLRPALLAALLTALPLVSRAVILYRTGNPAANTSAPTDGLAGSGYPTRISSKLAWIYGVTDPSGDLENDGVPNLLEYALHANPLASDAARLPLVGLEGSFLTLTYSKVTSATDIQYVVEKSSDLLTWTAANPTNEILDTQANVQTIKAKVARNGATQLFLRLRITRP